jgi:cytosine/adenosine deaminase-related metal-dependent hydrolase
MNILRHVTIEKLQGLGIGHIAPIKSADFVVLSSTELRVLLPEIGFDRLERLQKSQNRDIAFHDWGALVVLRGQ